ncbi:type II toxin-antitoxin system VapC family toxin [Reyranella sp. CPCC 100927]|uniref:type II toxin-antitoxin system VapC family toxin n=1 Tax=Reyranella sp. CPCC 100927 TaxID=2599616 RepID=UPI0011B4C5C2|nr:type II toxin-antitoxin system VapC family toxin [Reyranella sp. CPCC 100927]TWT03047.1 type II toxin-antitoxin system VapC family toxin [Reyranella sp. CPCC 100927]
MIVVDSSAVIAIFRQEDDAARYARSIAGDSDPIISAANLLEVSIVLRALKKIPSEKAERWLDEFIDLAGIRIEPVTAEQAQVARAAHMRFGKGTGHGAALNYGDCFAYALAKETGALLLCKGQDFPLTDISIA